MTFVKLWEIRYAMFNNHYIVAIILDKNGMGTKCLDVEHIIYII